MARPKNAAQREERRDEAMTLIRASELFHESGLWIHSRTIYLGSEWVDTDGGEGGTDAKMAERFIKNLHVLEHIDHSPVTVIQNNLGGDEYHGAAIFDAIKTSPCRITIVVRGHAMSMGSIILQAAHERVVGPNSVQMIHYGTWGVNHHSKTAWKHALEGKRWDHWMEQLYLARIQEKRPKFRLSELRKMLDHDTYLTASQSVELGLADRIG